MWQEIITYTILAVTFGSVLYKSVIRPLVRLFTNKQATAKAGFSPVCATCSPGISCENCAFYNPRPATYRYKSVKSDFAQVSRKDSNNNGIVRITPLEYTAH